MGNKSSRMLLKVVGRQPMIFGTYKRLEECPCFSGKSVEKNGLVGCQPCWSATERSADPPCDNRRGKPDRQYGAGYSQHTWSRECQEYRSGGCNSATNPHGPAGGNQARAVILIPINRRTPFEKIPTGKQHPPRETRNCIYTEKRLIRECNKCKSSLSEMHSCRPQCNCEVLTYKHPCRFL